MADIEKAFAFLHDNTSPWITQIAEIDDKIAKMQCEVAKMPVARVPMKRRTGSVESIRDLNELRENPTTSAATQQPPVPSQKRKTTSVLSGAASGPCKYRARNMIIVYYDGEIQKQFEALVRSIGTGRNLLRKGKMAARLQAMADLASSDDESEDDDDDDNIMSKIQYRRRTGLSSMRSRAAMRAGRGDSPSRAPTPESLFDSIDKTLEQAQSLCERAAHQSLRDGHCQKELEGMKKYFQEVLETATKEMAKYSAKKEKTGDRGTETATEVQISLPPPKIVSPPQFVPLGTMSKPTMAGIQPIPTVFGPSKAMDIEIDDDDSDDGSFVIPPVRLTSRA